MIKRTILTKIYEALGNWPVVLITGARQVGKTTICNEIEKESNYNYISLDNTRNRFDALNDPEGFLESHPWPLIIDEVQYVPSLFDVIEGIVNDQKRKTGNNKGMYILTGSESYNLIQGITESMAGRVAIINIKPLSFTEVNNLDAGPFNLDLIRTESNKINLNRNELFDYIYKGFYPSLYDNINLKPEDFYANYVSTYIDRDISQIININDKYKFQQFMEVLASLTGEELIIDNLAKNLNLNNKTITNWLSILLAGDIIYLLEPYNERSTLKRVVKRPKIYFNDTGLACYLARINDPLLLQNSYLSGRFVETYIINEIIKSYKSNNKLAYFYYYRDIDQKEIDLIINVDGKLNFVECKSGTNYNLSDVKAFNTLANKTSMPIGFKCIICLTNTVYSLGDNTYAIPITSI